MLNSSTKIRVNSPPTQLVSVWIRHEYFAARKRVEMPWTKSRKLDFDHSITSLIHPLTTLRQVKYRIKWLTKNSTTTIFYGINFSLKNRMNNCLNFPLFLSNDWGAPHSVQIVHIVSGRREMFMFIFRSQFILIILSIVLILICTTCLRINVV